MQHEILKAMAKTAGAEHDIQPSLLIAMSLVETADRTYATRFEINSSRYLTATRNWANRTKVTEDTERVGQKTSWGIMQVMGFRARELGFAGLFPELTQVALGLRYGCLALKDCQRRFGKPGTLGFDENVVAAYNAGSPRDLDKDGKLDNHEYVAKVFANFEPWEKIAAQERIALVKMKLRGVA